jgi:hypothetical protein
VALLCPRCGTDNPAGNAFCMSCGSPLAAAPPTAPPPPPLSGAPFVPDPDATQTFVPDPDATQTFLPPGYVAGASPYLPAPPAGTAPPHRTSSTMIIAIVVIVLVIVGGGGVAYAALHKGATTVTVPGNVPVSVPTTAPTSRPTQPPPTPAPTSAPTPSSSGGGKILTTTFASVFVPTGYTVSDQESDYIVLGPSNDAEDAVGVQAEPLVGATTNAELDQDLLAADQQSDDPSAHFCSTNAPSQTQIRGSAGAITADVITICENLTPLNGPAFSAVDEYIDGVAMASDGSFTAVFFEVLAPASSYPAFSKSIPSAFFSRTTFTDAGPPS